MRGLEFNPSALHLLASGGAEGELCIWDVTNTASPTQYPAVKVWGSLDFTHAWAALSYASFCYVKQRTAPTMRCLTWQAGLPRQGCPIIVLMPHHG